jgi:hypothetical protein
VGRKDELGRELEDTSREMSDNVTRAEQVRDERNAEIDLIERAPRDLDPDDLDAIDRAAEGVRRESGEDFERSVETKQAESERRATDVSNDANQERDKVRQGAEQLDQVDGSYGRSDIGSAQAKLDESAGLLEQLSESAQTKSQETRDKVDAARSELK